jgi:hypothetical protein
VTRLKIIFVASIVLLLIQLWPESEKGPPEEMQRMLVVALRDEATWVGDGTDELRGKFVSPTWRKRLADVVEAGRVTEGRISTLGPGGWIVLESRGTILHVHVYAGYGTHVSYVSVRTLGPGGRAAMLKVERKAMEGVFGWGLMRIVATDGPMGSSIHPAGFEKASHLNEECGMFGWGCRK